MKRNDYSVEELLNPSRGPYVLKPIDVADMLGVSIDYARFLFHQDDFPSFLLGSRMVVSKMAFFSWLNKQRYRNGD